MDTRSIRVLLVDDDEDDYIIARDLLFDIRGKRFTLDWVETYDDALAVIGQNKHDVYLFDYHLGERDGLQLIQDAIENGCKAPIVLLTGQGDHKVDLEAMKAGAADYLIKGQIGSSLLERSIRYAIQRARLIEGLEAQVAARTAEIQAEKEKSETILRSVGDAIVMSDLEMIIRYVNPAFTKMTGYKALDVMGRRINFLFGEDMSEQQQQSLHFALIQGKAWQGETIARRKDSRIYEAAMTIAPVRDAQGQLIGYVSSHRDISKLKDLDRARRQFITSVSHELRTPVTNLKLYNKLLRRGQCPEKHEHYLNVLEQQTDRLADLIQEILEMTAFDSGEILSDWELVHLSTIIGSVLTRFHSQAQASPLTLTATPLPRDLPVLEGDSSRLTQALGEVVKNAILFTPAGGKVTVETRAVENEGQNWVTIAVRDTGPGISPEEQTRVFDRFYRGSVSESGHIPGTGLGLCKTQEIMCAHGGKVTLESDGVPGQGSTFTLWLPAAFG